LWRRGGKLEENRRRAYEVKKDKCRKEDCWRFGTIPNIGKLHDQRGQGPEEFKKKKKREGGSKIRGREKGKFLREGTLFCKRVMGGSSQKKGNAQGEKDSENHCKGDMEGAGKNKNFQTEKDEEKTLERRR